MELAQYEVTIHGLTYTMQLDGEGAREYGDRAVPVSVPSAPVRVVKRK